jgi:aminoglycoside 2''-phosphotransferase
MKGPASGFSNLVYELGDGNVRRVPRTPEARETCLRQCRFLPRLASYLPVLIPVPSDCDGAMMVYRKLEGQPLQPKMLEHLDAAQLARDIASFMCALHTLPAQDAVSWGIPAISRTAQLLAAADRVLPAIPSEFRSTALMWRERFVELPHADAPIHGDLWHENILIDQHSGRLSGVLDFDEASIGDPAWDLATQLHCGRAFAKLVFDAYSPKDPTLWARAEALFRLRPFEGLDWAVRYRDAEEFEDGLKKLHEVDVLPAVGINRTTPAP